MLQAEQPEEVLILTTAGSYIQAGNEKYLLHTDNDPRKILNKLHVEWFGTRSNAPSKLGRDDGGSVSLCRGTLCACIAVCIYHCLHESRASTPPGAILQGAEKSCARWASCEAPRDTARGAYSVKRSCHGKRFSLQLLWIYLHGLSRKWTRTSRPLVWALGLQPMEGPPESGECRTRPSSRPCC